MVGAVPSMPIVKHLVLSRTPLELHHEDCLYIRPLTGSRTRVDRFNGDAFLE
jgi:hypothetical protein